MVMPATGPQSRLLQGLDAFRQVIKRQVESGCLARRGVPLPAGPPPLFIRFQDVPDLPYLAAHGFDPAAPPLAPLPSPSLPAVVAGPRADAAAVTATCLAAGVAQVATLNQLIVGLNSAWLGQLSVVDADPGVQAAFRGLPACLRGQHVEAADEDGFFRVVDSVPDAPARRRALASAYARCMIPIEAAREPLRVRVREQLISAHPQEVARLRAELPAQIHELEQRNQVRLCFPAV